MNTYTDNEDIFKDTFTVDPAAADIITHISYAYSPNFAKNCFIETDKKEDAAAASDHGREYPETIELDWVRDQATADDVAQRILDDRKYAPMDVSFATAIHGLQDDLADSINVVHFAAPGNLTDPVIAGIDIDLDNLIISISSYAGG